MIFNQDSKHPVLIDCMRLTRSKLGTVPALTQVFLDLIRRFFFDQTVSKN